VTPTTQIAALVDESHAAAVTFLRELVRVPSDTPPGNNARHAERAAQLLEALGFVVERCPVPEQEVANHGLSSITNLIVRQRFGDGPIIALNAHGDAVPPGEGWSKPPYEGLIENGRMYGRGVAVSKSDFATYAFALLALRKMNAKGQAFKGTVELHFTYDEEVGGELGPAWLLAKKLTTPDFAIGAGFSYSIVTAHNGCLHLEVTVHGKSAHAGVPHAGIDAIRGAAGILNALYALDAGYATIRSAVAGITSPTLNVGRIEGGINTNVVPDKVVFKLDRRMIPEENPAQVESDLCAVIDAASRAFPGLRTEVRRLLLAESLKPLPGHEKLVRALQAHAERVMGEAIPVTGVPLYTDARLYAEAGVPIVLYGAGPRTILESNAKQADENLLLDDLRRATQVVACALHDLLA
jgi:succinyl-diaminopimelate desuccinylase